MNLRLSIALVATVAMLQGCSSDIDRLNSGEPSSPGTGGADGSAGGGTGPSAGDNGGSDAATGGGTVRVYDDNYVSTTSSTGSFTLFESSAAAPIVVNAADFAGVTLAATNLQADIQSVTGTIPTLVNDTIPATATQVIIIGTVGQSDLIASLVSAGKLDVSSITGKWEASLIQVVEAPVTGVDRALVIAGSDKRGTIYGIYDLSKKIGVSPWYWWADVPAQTKTAVYVSAGTHALNSPSVKYRGIFLNDEDPELNGLVAAKFGRYNTNFYDKVFELLLRLKANYLWPAMWGKAFAVDDPNNPAEADKYGIVMGTSHEEAMMRAEQEWTNANAGAWEYTTNSAALTTFWKGGITRMGTNESYVTVGMRGQNDTAISSTNMTLLQQIITDQRAIINDATGKDPATVPQVLSLYKEVETFYDQGLQLPADVTVEFSDDNFGNVRRLPTPGDTSRTGGYGLYYHFDYHGSPRSYQWLNSSPIPRIWEQLHLAYGFGAKQLWVVNVGDLKPLEFPIEFFMDYAWNPDNWPADSLQDYTRLWAERQFGSTNAAAIADILTKYTKYNGRRKPELLDPSTYTLTNYLEAETVVSDYNNLVTAAQTINDSLPPAMQNAFFELVLWPVKASANLNDLYVTAAKNALYAAQGRASTNDLATRVSTLMSTDASLTSSYNSVANKKWIHMADQVHIGYTTWQAPSTNVAPTTKTITVPSEASMGVAIEGFTDWWPSSTSTATLGEFSPYAAQTSRYIDVFNRGQTSFDFTASSTADWVTITPASGTITTETRLAVSIDWTTAPTGTQQAPITITGPSSATVTVQVAINNPASPSADQVKGFVETNGYISIEAEHYTSAVDASGITWQVIPDLSRTSSGVTAFPVTATRQTPGGTSAHLEYNLFLFNTGTLKITSLIAPSLNFTGNGLKYGISVDDGAIQTVDLTTGMTTEDSADNTWQALVSVNIYKSTTSHSVTTAGSHVLNFWLVDPGVVLEKLVVETTGAKTSYLGPPESELR